MLVFVLARLFGTRIAGDEPSDSTALSALEDEALMARFARGEAPAFEELFARYERRIVNFVYRSVGDRGRAEELAQDVFLKVIGGADRYRPTAKFSTWIFTIARNACVDESRRRRHRRAASLDAPVRSDEPGGTTLLDRVVDEDAASGTGSIARAEFVERLQTALADLPDEQREVFVLRHYDGMRFVDIGRMFDISENTVKSRMRYALQSLRAALEDFEGFSFDATDTEEVGGR
jgi:RNA polymerase sigma-70 factor (ECF subfamily)